MLDVLLELRSASLNEVARSPSYNWNNRLRKSGGIIFQYTWSGQGHFQREQTVRTCGPGQAMLMLEGGRTKYFFPKKGGEPWEFTWINFCGARPLVAELIRLHGDVVRLDPHGETVGELKLMARLYETKEFLDRYHAAEILARFLCSLGRELSGLRAKDGVPIRQALNYLRDHHRRPINIKEVADKFSLSREHFTRAFHGETGTTPARFLRDLRLQTARHLLQGTRMTLREVAGQSGFGSSTHFCRAFKNAFGHSPKSLPSPQLIPGKSPLHWS